MDIEVDGGIGPSNIDVTVVTSLVTSLVWHISNLVTKLVTCGGAVCRAACPDMDIEVDGGIGPANIDECAKAGRPPYRQTKTIYTSIYVYTYMYMWIHACRYIDRYMDR